MTNDDRGLSSILKHSTDPLLCAPRYQESLAVPYRWKKKRHKCKVRMLTGLFQCPIGGTPSFLRTTLTGIGRQMHCLILILPKQAHSIFLDTPVGSKNSFFWGGEWLAAV